MAPTAAELLAAHEARLDNHDEQIKSVSDEVRALKNWIMATLGAALIGVALQFLRLH